MNAIDNFAGSFEKWIGESRTELIKDLCELVAIPTCSPSESAAHSWLAERFEALGSVVREEARHEGLADHPAANRNRYLAIDPKKRASLHVQLPRCGGLRRTLFSAHVDVVPTGPGFEDGFNPRVADGVVTGRGTADTKGNIVMLLAALRFLKETGIARRREVEVDLVNEEEIGGNGALSTLMYGRAVDDVIVLEPTSLEVFHGHRGCLEFTAHVQGRPVHQGASQCGISAIHGAVRLIEKLGQLEQRLLAEARQDPDFSSWERPLQVNVGRIAGGEWHGSVSESCLVGGTVGFLPSYSALDIRAILQEICQSPPAGLLEPTYHLVYEGIHNEAYRGETHSKVADAMRRAVLKTGGAVRVPRAWNVSCDARLYQHIGGLPVIIFGAGNLEQAHTNQEHLHIGQFERGVRALATFLTDGEAP